MTTKQVREGQYQTIIDWLKAHVQQYEPTPIDRVAISQQCNTPDWMVARTILMLSRNGVLLQSGSLYTLTDLINDTKGAAILEWNDQYNRDSAKRSRQKGVLELDLQQEPTPLERATELFNSNLAEFKFGYYCPTNGFQWHTSPEEAAEKAKLAAIDHNLGHLDIVQKVGKVHNQPTVTFY